MPDKDKLVIWPLYFDVRRSRSQGRMVSSQDAVADPILDDVISAATRAGYKPEVEREKKHPKTWPDSSGRILLPKKGPKSKVLRSIARSMKKKGKRS